MTPPPTSTLHIEAELGGGPSAGEACEQVTVAMKMKAAEVAMIKRWADKSNLS